MTRWAVSDLTETFAYDRAGNRVDPEKVPVRPEVETFAERVARHTREQAQWEAANPGRQYYMGTRPDERANREDALMAEYERRLPKCLDNLLKELEHTRYHYDERGNLIRRIDWGGPTWVYRYDLSNRLVEASRYAKTPEDTTDQHGTDAHHRHRTYIGRTVPELTATYRYDAFGRRTVKEVMQPDGNTDITVFVWDGDVLLIEERFTRTPQKPAWSRPVAPEPALASMVREDPEDAYSLPVAQRAHALDVAWQGVSLYLHEPGTFVPLARLDEKLVEPAYLATGTDGRAVRVPAKTTHTTLFYLNDHLGTPQEIVNDSGKVVWIGRYRAWGAVKKGTKVWQEKPNPGRTVNPIRFQGQYYDEETGLHYNRHRYYDPDAGRFISRDPIGLAGGINGYAYAPNPVQWIDPLGLTSTTPPACGCLDWSRTNPRTGETAVDHVMQHGNDNSVKPSHGVFADDPIATTNAAWDKAVQTGIAPTVGGNRNWNYDIPYPEAGLGGGISGNAAGNPILNSVRIVTTPGTNQVVTSFPN
ncbi:RHS repeat-associated core domain-containing protein [Paraburkholderia sp. ZP32-5]|uniref:RHS repeat-associated core domain-containing protein n=1 Tax=Paraburkholderia sp. ZP32-5 TaxID=2883245 RepID=UPI002DD44806|nr:RHS repeat-associated core domain-containing protein [Paraburkholderia sp. ZP32-5]